MSETVSCLAILGELRRKKEMENGNLKQQWLIVSKSNLVDGWASEAALSFYPNISSLKGMPVTSAEKTHSVHGDYYYYWHWFCALQ